MLFIGGFCFHRYNCAPPGSLLNFHRVAAKTNSRTRDREKEREGEGGREKERKKG